MEYYHVEPFGRFTLRDSMNDNFASDKYLDEFYVPVTKGVFNIPPIRFTLFERSLNDDSFYEFILKTQRMTDWPADVLAFDDLWVCISFFNEYFREGVTLPV